MFRNFKTPIISLYRDFAMKTGFTERMNVENLVLLSQHSPAEPKRRTLGKASGRFNLRRKNKITEGTKILSRA